VPNALLYLITVLIWGSTWLAIKFQLGIVPPALSILPSRLYIASRLLPGSSGSTHPSAAYLCASHAGNMRSWLCKASSSSR
jgi:hypothetical protein